MNRFQRSLPVIGLAFLCASTAYGAMSAAAARRLATINASTLRAAVRQARVEAAEAKALAEFGDRVIDLPEDGAAWHTSVFTHDPPAPDEQRMLAWFASDPQLLRLKQQTHFHHYTPRSSVYARFANVTAAGLPAIVLQDATGQVVYKASGDNAPSAPWPLVKGIIECVRAHCPHCPRPKPQPAPEPTPDPTPGPPNLVPDVVGPNQNTPLNGRDDTVPVTIAVFLLTLVAGFLAAAGRDTRRLL
ncbi:MAG TPA: hypothetical protein VGN42_12870 [Pirellulales bacterium]|jgi:hypothetical protein|nr:hypothetical protein [Pirellulales bacterium]